MMECKSGIYSPLGYGLIKLRGFSSTLLLILLGGFAQAGEQQVAIQPSVNSPSVGEIVQANVTYTTANPQDPTLTGIGVRLHWNSKLMEFQQLTGILASQLSARSEPQADTANYDADPATDKFIHLAWADITNNWPNQGASPVSLFTAEFLTPAAVVGTSPLNLSTSSTAAGFDFTGTPASVAVDCTGTYIEIQSRTFQTGENISCTSSGNMVVGPYIDQKTGSSLQLTATTGIAINGPLSIATGATFVATHGGP